MGCQTCKEIIDNQAALVHQLTCMSNSILLAADRGQQPTAAMSTEFRAAADTLAKVSGRIEAYVNPASARSDTGTNTKP